MSPTPWGPYSPTLPEPCKRCGREHRKDVGAAVAFRRSRGWLVTRDGVHGWGPVLGEIRLRELALFGVTSDEDLLTFARGQACGGWTRLGAKFGAFNFEDACVILKDEDIELPSGWGEVQEPTGRTVRAPVHNRVRRKVDYES
jgi:hypothetical protein